MFDKLLYWKRRKEGKRGQGDEFSPVVGHAVTFPQATSHKQPTKKALLKNTKRARKQNAEINNH